MIKKVTSIVISVHLLFIALLLFTPPYTPTKRTNHVKVRTVRPMTVARSAPTRAPTSSSGRSSGSRAVAPPQKSSTLAKAKPAPAAAASKKPKATSQTSAAPAAKKPSTSKKPSVVERGKPVKKATPPKKNVPSQEVWEEIDQALAKIEKKSYSSSKITLDVPETVKFLDEVQPAAFGIEGALENDARSALAGYLEESLHLPDVGEVKIRITVRKDGTIANVVVVSSESSKNKSYLQEHLPKLQFPMQFDEEKTWTLVFNNEI